MFVCLKTRKMLRKLINAAILVLLLLPTIFSYQLESKVLDMRLDLAEISMPSFEEQLSLLVLDHMFGVGMSCLLLILFGIIHFVVSSPEIFKKAAIISVASGMDDRDEK